MRVWGLCAPPPLCSGGVEGEKLKLEGPWRAGTAGFLGGARTLTLLSLRPQKAVEVMCIVPKRCNDMMNVGRLQGFDVMRLFLRGPPPTLPLSWIISMHMHFFFPSFLLSSLSLYIVTFFPSL